MNISAIHVENIVFDKENANHTKIAHKASWYKKGRVIHVHDNMQKDYAYRLDANPGEDFHKGFTPHLSPEKMLKLGVFEGKYCRDCINEFPSEWFETAKFSRTTEPDHKVNCFGVKSRSSLNEWNERDWIHLVDPRGWFQWYMRYYLGRRLSGMDEAQIKRWSAFTRHSAQVKQNCEIGDVNCRPRQRQALLQWSHDPFI